MDEESRKDDRHRHLATAGLELLQLLARLLLLRRVETVWRAHDKVGGTVLGLSEQLAGGVLLFVGQQLIDSFGEGGEEGFETLEEEYVQVETDLPSR